MANASVRSIASMHMELVVGILFRVLLISGRELNGFNA